MLWKFFPVVSGGKQPALEGDWRGHASDNDNVIDAWETDGYDLGLDCEASDLTIIDIDGPQGEQALQALEIKYGRLPETYEARTPRGGRHLYFTGRAPSSVQKLGPKLDTRGEGGYVVFQGPGYTTVRDIDPAPLPEWVRDELAKGKADKLEAGVATLDLPHNIERARRYAADCPPAIEGEGGDSHTYKTAAWIMDLGVSPETCFNLMCEHFNPRCDPPWGEDELLTKVSNASTFRQNDLGAWGVPSLAEGFAHLGLATATASAGDDPFQVHDEPGQDALREPSWLLPDVIPDDSVVMLYGPPGSYKSFLALDLGMTMASGHAGWGAPARKPVNVVYVAGEGPRSIARLRRPAWRTLHGIDGPLPFGLVTNMPLAYDDGAKGVDAFIESVKRQDFNPKLVIIDTWARLMLGLNENDAKEAGLGIAALEAIKRSLKCSVLVVHHTGKESGSGPRGSSAIMGGVDSLHEVVPAKGVMAVAVHNRRHKDADERDRPWCFEGKTALQSLVFQPIRHEDYLKLTVEDDTLSQQNVARALAALKARGPGNEVGTRHLAQQLRPIGHGEDPTAALLEIERLEKRLGQLAGKSLDLFAIRGSKPLRWVLPG